MIESGEWSGTEETVDLSEGFGGERVDEMVRVERDEIWDGILSLVCDGGGEKREESFGGRKKWVGRIVDREREIEAVERLGLWG